MPAGAYCTVSAGARTGALDVVCLVVRGWLSGQTGGLGANAVTRGSCCGCVGVFGTVRYGLVAEGREGTPADLSVVHANQGR